MFARSAGLILFCKANITFEVHFCLLVVTGEHPALSQAKEDNRPADPLVDAMSTSHYASSSCEK